MRTGRRFARFGIVVVGCLFILLRSLTMESAGGAGAQGIPAVTVVMSVLGTPPAGVVARTYEATVVCRTASGAAVGQRVASLAPGASRTIGAGDIPGLATGDLCTVTAAAEGAQTQYTTTQTDRSDGSTPEPLGGIIDAGVFRSAPALANGQSVTVAHRYTGDLIISKVVSGAPETSIGTYQLQVTCGEVGFLQTLLLSNGQTRLITGIPVGSTCRVTEPSTPASRFEDNSGDPLDGIVTIVSTAAPCWDLRNTAPSCRVTVVSTHAYSAADQQLDSVLNTVPGQATTTTPRTETTLAAAATTAAPAAPAPVEEPSILDESEETVS